MTHPPKTTQPCPHLEHETVRLFENGHCSCELDVLRAEAERLKHDNEILVNTILDEKDRLKAELSGSEKRIADQVSEIAGLVAENDTLLKNQAGLGALFRMDTLEKDNERLKAENLQLKEELVKCEAKNS